MSQWHLGITVNIAKSLEKETVLQQRSRQRVTGGRALTMSDSDSETAVDHRDTSSSDDDDDDELSMFTAFDLIENELDSESCPIITFCQELDNAAGGGVRCGMITEIFGDKGIGKTTLCYQIAIDVQIPHSLGGLASECFYIDTENTVALNRLRVMATKCADHCRDVRSDSHITTDSLLEGIHYKTCGSVEELQNIIVDLEDYLKVNDKIKLLIIDSLAFIFYTEAENFNAKGKVLYKIAQELTQLATKFSIAIVITNNMTTRFEEGGREYKIPYLGEVWNQVANIRLMLVSDRGIRSARLIKSATPNAGTGKFRITSAGIRK